MSDFEVCAIGTQSRLALVEAFASALRQQAEQSAQRLAQVEVERDALREILDHIPQVEAELAETSDKLHAMTVERDALRAEVERITVNGTHSCHAECQRPVCRLTRERDALLEALKLARSIIGHPDDAHSQMIDAAIAKAEGGGNG